MAYDMKHMLEHPVSILTCDGKNIFGTLKGFDQLNNVVLENCHERVFSPYEGVEQIVLGLYILRGDNIAVIGEVDEELDSQLDLATLKGESLKPVVQ